MAFLKNFEHDIFISYAHIDNRSDDAIQNGWIDCFHRELKQILDRKIGKADAVNIWFDTQKIEGNTLFDTRIERGIKASAIMICIVSPGYLGSDYCNLELNAFHTKIKSEEIGTNINDQSRIINVLIDNIHHTKWPHQLKGTTGFNFYDALGDRIEDVQELRREIKKVRSSVLNLLTSFQEQETQSKPEKHEIKIDPIKNFTIYLGDVADTLKSTRKRIVTELEKKGFNIVTSIPPPEEELAHAIATKAALKKSNLAIHLLDQYPGREINGLPTICYPQRQTEIALQTDKSQIIWVPAETDFNNIDDEEYKYFLTGLENRNTQKKEYEFIRGTTSTISKEIIDFAEQLKAEQTTEKRQKGQLNVLLDTHLKDQLYAFELSKALIHNGIQPYVNPEEGDPRENMAVLEERMKKVSKLIFMYGNVSKDWLINRITVAIHLVITKNYPIDSFHIFMVSPQKNTEDLQSIQKYFKIDVHNSSGQFDLDQNMVADLLRGLKTEAA